MCSFLLQVPLLSILLIYSTRAGWNFFFFQSKLGRQMVFRRYRCDSFHCLFNGALLASKALLFSNEKIVIFAGTVEKQAAMQEEEDLELYVCSNEGACFINQSWRLPEISSPLSSSGFAHGAAWAAVGQSSAIPVSAEAFQRAHGLFCWYRGGGRGCGKAVGSLGMASECLMRGQYGGCGPVPSLEVELGADCLSQLALSVPSKSLCVGKVQNNIIYIYIFGNVGVFCGLHWVFFVCVFFFLLSSSGAWSNKRSALSFNARKTLLFIRDGNGNVVFAWRITDPLKFAISGWHKGEGLSRRGAVQLLCRASQGSPTAMLLLTLGGAVPAVAVSSSPESLLLLWVPCATS